MRFLVIDDSALDRKLLTYLLEGMGHEVDLVADTEGSLEKIADNDYASVFLDIVMPEEDGYKFLRNLRINQATAKQHVVFCSSKKSKLEINYGIKRGGADDYLVKPVTRENLAKILENFQATSRP